MITKRKKTKYMNEVVIMLMQENEKLIVENKKLNNLLDLTLMKSGSPHEEQSY